MNIRFEDLLPLGRKRLIQTAHLVVVALVAVLASARYIITDEQGLPPSGLIVTFCVLANYFYLRRGGSTDIAASGLVGILLAGLGYGGYITGGFNGPVILFAPVLPIFTLLLLHTRGAWITLACVCVELAVMYVLELGGLVPPNSNPPELILTGRFITMLVLCLLANWVVWNFGRISNQLLETIEKQSNTDYLTGIMNRRAIESSLQQEVNRARRSGVWLSLILMDVDNFKQYNDDNGHLAGDRALVNIAQVIQSCIKRSTDDVGRFGGEEFVVILSDTNAEGAVRVAEGIRNALLDRHIPYSAGNPKPVSMTLGVTSINGAAIESMEQLIRHADEALYRGKHQGRNCVVSTVLGASGIPRTYPRVTSQES